MLLLLARGDVQTFNNLAIFNPLYTNHLLGYGILEENDGRYSFRIESIQDHLQIQEKYKRTEMSQQEMRGEISERRNDLEQKLRRLCRMQLRSHLGEATARASVEQLMGQPRTSRNAGLSYSDLFDGTKSGILFSDLPKFVRKYWECFEHILGPDKDDVLTKLALINNLRADAHAKNITHDEFQMFRICVEVLDKRVSDFLM